ncbi:hypothetical protein Pcinc_037383 [Petrolisthes cinctipes]|uniref:Uncharacterized protein n=1 Tax=Petrolisthes cinctipes TaxID=88211 RepID=A0AAE1EP07_PETCI|nr:hypothetical protein Pcinc_037383 [Petrolisthes cinctipes]
MGNGVEGGGNTKEERETTEVGNKKTRNVNSVSPILYNPFFPLDNIPCLGRQYIPLPASTILPPFSSPLPPLLIHSATPPTALTPTINLYQHS